MTYEDIMNELGLEPLYDLTDDDIEDDPEFDTREFDDEELTINPYPEEAA